MAGTLAMMASSPADYERLGLSPTSIAPWEDGARTDDSAGTYEWWYFDAHLADGAKLVVTFMNKDIAEPQKPLSPLLRLDLDLPDGRHFEKLVHYPLGEWLTAKDRADVRLGENRFTGDLHRYRIQATAGGDLGRCHLDRRGSPVAPVDRVHAVRRGSVAGIRLASLGASGRGDHYVLRRRGAARDDGGRLPRPQLGAMSV